MTAPDPAAERQTMIDAEVFLTKQAQPLFGELSDAECAAAFPAAGPLLPEHAERAAAMRAARATQDVDDYLARTPLPWEPGMWTPTPPRFVSHPVFWRAAKATDGKGRVGGCEDCHEHDQLVLHHLHYLSVGREVPSDFAFLCRTCHHIRHGTHGGGSWHLDRTPQALAAAGRAARGRTSS